MSMWIERVGNVKLFFISSPWCIINPRNQFSSLLLWQFLFLPMKTQNKTMWADEMIIVDEVLKKASIKSDIRWKSLNTKWAWQQFYKLTKIDVVVASKASSCFCRWKWRWGRAWEAITSHLTPPQMHQVVQRHRQITG